MPKYVKNRWRQTSVLRVLDRWRQTSVLRALRDPRLRLRDIINAKAASCAGSGPYTASSFFCFEPS